MNAIFISDAHLKGSHQEGYKKLLRFFDLIGKEKSAQSSKNIHDLFILGDFFDFWLCKNERIYPEFKPIIDKLFELKQKGIHVHFCEGNHDFFLKSFFLDKLGMDVYTEFADINRKGKRIFLSHGDTIDQANKEYLLLRKILRSPFLAVLQKSIPLRLAWKIAGISSNMSKELSPEAGDEIAVKMEVFSLQKFHEGIDAVILGHCHKPMLKEYSVDGKIRIFATLGDWIKHFSYLYYENGQFTLCYFKD
jgi:UDP-2,3-diacylglucosamine hydrolase